jgi:hypothetical protein
MVETRGLRSKRCSTCTSDWRDRTLVPERLFDYCSPAISSRAV